MESNDPNKDDDDRADDDAQRVSADEAFSADTFESIKHEVLAEIKRRARRISVREAADAIGRRDGEAVAVLERLARMGFLTRSDGLTADFTGRSGVSSTQSPRVPLPGEYEDDDELERVERQWDQVLEARDDESLFDAYTEHAGHVARRARAGFIGHATTFLGVQAFLFGVWLFVAGGGFPWFLFPFLGWGIGVASHFASTWCKNKEHKELTSFDDMNREQLRVFRRLAKARASWVGHVVSNAAVSLLLMTINLVTSPGFLWFLFPVGGMAIGVVTHTATYLARKRSLLKRLKDAGARILPRRKSIAGASGRAEQARRIRDTVLDQAKSFGDNAPFGDEFVPVLDNYVAQIEELEQKSAEIDQIIGGIPTGELDRDLAALVRKQESSDDARMVAEYSRSIEEIERQRSSLRELRNEREVLALRLNSSLNALKQMQIDLARMKSVSTPTQSSSFMMIKDKSDELTRYLDDLRSAYTELED